MKTSAIRRIIEDDRQASGLFIVADGMGGYHAGEVASKIAVETVRETLTAAAGADQRASRRCR